jgi:hypothetical protein
MGYLYNWKNHLLNEQFSLDDFAPNPIPNDTLIKKHNRVVIGSKLDGLILNFIDKYYKPILDAITDIKDRKVYELELFHGIVYWLVERTEILTQYKITNYLGEGSFGVVLELENEHTIKFFYESYESVYKADESLIDVDLLGAQDNERNLYSKKHSKNKMTIFDSGRTKFTFDGVEAEIFWYEMPKFIPLMKKVDSAKVKEMVGTAILQLRDLAITQLSYYKARKNVPEARRIITNEYLADSRINWDQNRTLLTNKDMNRILDIVIDSKQKQYLAEISKLFILKFHLMTSENYNEYPGELEKDCFEFTVNLFNSIYNLAKQDKIWDIYARNIGISPQSPTNPIIFDY